MHNVVHSPVLHPRNPPSQGDRKAEPKQREPNTVRERHVMHVHVCSSVNKELSVCIHTPMWCVCACTHTCYGRHYMHGTALQTQYVPEVPLKQHTEITESNSIYVQTLFMIRCKTSSESPFCAMSLTESGQMTWSLRVPMAMYGRCVHTETDRHTYVNSLQQDVHTQESLQYCSLTQRHVRQQCSRIY